VSAIPPEWAIFAAIVAFGVIIWERLGVIAARVGMVADEVRALRTGKTD
jgi:hypothetical protein